MPIDLQHLQNQSNTPPPPPQKKSAWWDFLNKDISLFKTNWGAKKKVVFYETLETLLNSGLDIQNSLTLTLHSFTKQQDKNIVAQIQQAMLKGDALSDALQQNKYFSAYEIFSIKIGEESGKLLDVLAQLSSFFNKSLKFQRQLIGALAYPIFVLTFSIFAVVFLLRYLVPMFSGIYGRFGKELPSLTRFIVYLSDALATYTPYFIAVSLSLIAFIYWQRKKIWWQKISASILLNLPIIGKVIHKIYLARFCEAIQLLLAARVPLLNSVQLVSQMIPFYPIQKALRQTEIDIMAGSSLHNALQKYTFFPPTLLALIRVGEESGKMDFIFKRLSLNLHQEIDHQTALLGSILEPILIIFLGVLVAVVLIAMYLPLFQMGMNIN